MQQQTIKNKNILIILISCVIILILFVSSNFLRVLDKTIQNQYYEIKNEILGLQANPHIVIVELDEKSFSDIGVFPFPRSIYAKVLENLTGYKTAVVAFDILFLDPSQAEEDKLFVEAIARYPNVVLGSSLDSNGNIHTPFSAIKKRTYTTGFLHPNIEISNKTVYSFSPYMRDIGGEGYEHFTLQVLRSFYRYLYEDTLSILPMGSYTPETYLFSQDISYPLAQKDLNEILINFIPPESFTRISFSDLYNTESLKQIDKEIHLQDKILLVGPASEGLKDEFFTPNGVEYGVNIHANILNTLLSREYMTYFDRHLEWLMIFCIVLLSVSVNLSSSRRILIGANIMIVIVFWLMIPISILLGTNLILNYPAEIIFSLLLSFSSANIVKYLIEDKNKQKLNKALSEYVGSNIAEEILLGNGKINLDGQEKNLVCFFSDIEGFTSLSEILTPGELVTLLREYLSEMTSVIMDQKGHVDKFEGDAIMALWGAFTEHSNMDYIGACDTALIQQESLEKINRKWKKKLGKNLRIRIGIHGGKAIIGNIGAIGKKMDFTALGDNVNLASRLEGVNKYYGTKICVSETVYRAAKEFFTFRYLDEIQVKGKDIPVKIYELLGTQDISEEQEQFYNAFLEAIEYYKEKNFKDARDIFESLAEQGDTPSQAYIYRCEHYIENPPETDWNGVWRMTEK